MQIRGTITETRRKNESPVALYRRFHKRFRSSGIQPLARQGRFQMRKPSKQIRRKSRITSLKRGDQYRQMHRLGKLGSVD